MNKKKNILDFSFVFLILSLSVIIVFEFPTLFYYAPLALFAVWLIYRFIEGDKLKLSVSCILLAIFAIIYVYKIKDMNQDRFYPLYLYLYMVLFYFAGANVAVTEDRKKLIKREKSLEVIYISIAVMLAIYVMLTYAADFIDGGIAVNLKPMYLWNEGSRPSTDYAVMGIPAIVAAAYLFLCRRARFVSVLLLLCVIVSNMLTQRRTTFIIIPLVFAVCFVCVFVFRAWKKKTMIITGSVGLAAVIGCCGIAYWKSDLIESFLYGDELGRLSFANLSDILNNARFIAVKNLLANFSFSYIGGEHYAAQYGNPHNMWLNIYDNAGTLPFILFLLFTVITFYYLFKLCFFAKAVSPGTRCLLVTSFFAMIIQASLEPVLVSDTAFVLLMFYVFGAVKSFADCADEKYWITKRIFVKIISKKNVAV